MLEEEKEDIEKEVAFLIEEYLETSLHLYSNKDFKEIMLNEIAEYLHEWKYVDLVDYIASSIDHTLNYYQIPSRQEELFKEETDKITYSILENDLLLNGEKNVLKQRTPEWYQFRHNRFSASSIWKLLDTPGQYNSLIFEKCKDLETIYTNHVITNEHNPRNWGVKYEPVSLQIYSFKNPKTVVKSDYGCIPHPLYPFIGASPDGINIGPEKYGCMVEIKNIYNREIDGIPLEEYWIQMQIQMETCNLEECDFLETRFKEYETEEDFYLDQTPEFKGVILFFLAKSSEKENRFEYMPLYISLEKTAIELWMREMQERFQEDYLLYDRSYWYLDEYSCVNVKRNAPWFESALPIIENAWRTVEHEREHGSLHRAPKYRNKKTEENKISMVDHPVITEEKHKISISSIKVIKLG